MSEQEKTVAQRLTAAFDALSENKREYLLGFADGVVATKSGDSDEPEARE